jgi:hypothetical protein
VQVSEKLTNDDIRVLPDKPQVSLVKPLLEDFMVGRYAAMLSLVNPWRHVPYQVHLHTLTMTSLATQEPEKHLPVPNSEVYNTWKFASISPVCCHEVVLRHWAFYAD